MTRGRKAGSFAASSHLFPVAAFQASLPQPETGLNQRSQGPAPRSILHGQHERSAGTKNSEDLAATIPNCQPMDGPGASHSAAQDQRDFVNDGSTTFCVTAADIDEKSDEARLRQIGI
jgi:hypothetical protein